MPAAAAPPKAAGPALRYADHLNNGFSCVSDIDKICDWRREQEGIDDHFKGKGAKAFAENYREWWEVLIREAAAAEVLFDSFVLERLLNLVSVCCTNLCCGRSSLSAALRLVQRPRTDQDARRASDCGLYNSSCL